MDKCEFSENGLWEFLRQSKANALSLEFYTDTMRKRERGANRWIPILLVICALGNVSVIWIPKITPIAAGIATALIAVGVAIKDYAPGFFGLQSGEELREADELNAFYERLFIECELVFDCYHTDEIDREFMVKRYMELRHSEVEKGVRLNRIIRRIPGIIQKKINEQSETYIERVYKTKPKNEKP